MISEEGKRFMDRLERGSERSRELLKMLTVEHPEIFSEEYDPYPEDPDDAVLIYRERSPGNPYKGIIHVKTMTRSEMEILTPNPEMVYNGLRNQFNVAYDYNKGNETDKLMVLLEEGEGSDRRYRLTTVNLDDSQWNALNERKAENEN